MNSPAHAQPRRGFLGRLIAAATGGAWLGSLGKARPAEAQSDMPYIGEIRMFAGDFAPNGWAFCEGQLLPIAENDALFVLIGTTYGGDGQETFGLPDLRSRAPIHFGSGTVTYVLGENGGQEAVTLMPGQLPLHDHQVGASSATGDSADPSGRVPARNAAGVPHYGAAPDTNLSPGALLPAGGSAEHNNMQPYLGIHYIISLFGAFPPPP